MLVVVTCFTFQSTFAEKIWPAFKPLDARVAWSSDGNYHDTDDFLANPWVIFLFSAAKMTDKLVWFGYNCHGWETEKAREKVMKENLEGAIDRFAGFDKSVLIDEFNDRTEAMNKLVSEINKSSASDPLWIVGAGPMENIGKAVEKADATKLKFVTLLSHNSWNDDHAPKTHNSKYTVKFMTDKGIKYKGIPDQNNFKAPDSFTANGLRRSKNIFDFLKNHTDPRIRWLWTIRDEPLYESHNPSKGTYDNSDAGMAYWLLTGANNGGDAGVSPKVLKDFVDFWAVNTGATSNLHSLSGASESFTIGVKKSDGGFRVLAPTTATSIEIVSINGKVLNSTPVYQPNVLIPIVDPGMYLIRVNTPGQSFMKKLMVLQ